MIGLMYLPKSGDDRLPASLPGSEGPDSVKEQVEAEGKCGNYQTFLKRGFLKLSIMPK